MNGRLNVARVGAGRVQELFAIHDHLVVMAIEVFAEEVGDGFANGHGLDHLAFLEDETEI